MAITARRIQQGAATVTAQEIADMQASAVASMSSVIKETLQPAFAQIADSAGNVLGDHLGKVATSARRVMDSIQAEVINDIQELQQAVLVLPVDRPIRASWPLSCQVLDCTGESDKEKLN